MKRIYLDLETTGLDDDNSIIEIAAVLYDGDKRVTSFSGMGFDSTSLINLDALKVNGHTFATLTALDTEKALLIRFFNWLLKLNSNAELAGINIQFDYNLLKLRAKKYGIIVGSALPYRLHDISNVSRFLTKIGLLDIKNSGKGNSLKDLAVALNIQFDETKLHTAVGDTELYYPIDKRLEDMAIQAMCKCKV